MSNFPKGTKVNIPAGKRIGGECFVSVRINPEDDARTLARLYGTRLLNFEINSETLFNAEFMHTLAGTRVRVLTTDMDLSEYSKILDGLDRLDPVFVAEPDADLLRRINFLTSLNFRIHIDATKPALPADCLERALDFYLHNPLLTIPIEPFHTLLYTINQGRGYSLWDIEAENVKSNFYVSRDWKISLSKRWNSKGLNYGGLDDSWDKLENSDLFKRLSSFRLELFQSKSPCIFCAHLNLCGGFLRAIDKSWPCEPWQQVFSILRKESQRSKRLQQKIEQILKHGPATDRRLNR